eukprot:TRINITY_DN2334_c1_g1_i8.p1 TRINITY_DN2334_c1_g1~~TRINITY_DN2334_c1_g1_i8.p1  ORF type:complete len:187 (+),score=32.46 TRINITY_DN2334_c1_g1_i8:277-837(+)
MCGHCLCEKCIIHMLGCKQKKQKLSCPHCRKDMGRDCKKLASFPKNWTLLETLQVVNDAEERELTEVFDPSAFGLEALGNDSQLSSTSRSSSSIWVCTRCTLHNSNSVSDCEACDTPRPKRQRKETALVSTALSTLASTVHAVEDEDSESKEADPDSFLARLDRTYNSPAADETSSEARGKQKKKR